MSENKQDNTKLIYATPTPRAKAIESVAATHPDGVISVESLVINESNARQLAQRAIRLKEKDSAPSLNVERIEARYARLGQHGTSTMVEITVPDGIDSIDFEAFHGQVDELLPSGIAKVS